MKSSTGMVFSCTKFVHCAIFGTKQYMRYNIMGLISPEKFADVHLSFAFRLKGLFPGRQHGDSPAVRDGVGLPNVPKKSHQPFKHVWFVFDDGRPSGRTC